MNLNDAATAKTYVITKVEGRDSQRRRLLDMGFTPDSKIRVLAIAPFKGTILVNLRNFTVALREDAAALIGIEG